MSGPVRDEIRQTLPYTSLEQEAVASVVRTASGLLEALDSLLRTRDLGVSQYNVLRILRGSEPHGICRNDLRCRMFTRMPDMTRMLDRMEEAGLVVRIRDDVDRRMVLTHITDDGRRLLGELDGPVEQMHQRLLGHLTDAQLGSLIELLSRVRNRC